MQEQLRREFDPTGSGTGQTLHAVQVAFEAQQSDAHFMLQRQPLNSVVPELNPGVMESIRVSLSEWQTVCNLLKISDGTNEVSC